MQPGDYMPIVADDLPRLNTRENPWEFLPDSRTLVYFWSINCPSCSFLSNQLAQETKRSTWRVLSVHVPFSEKDLSIDRVNKVIEQNGFAFPVIMDQYHELVKAFSIQVVPVFFLFDRQRMLEQVFTGTEGFANIQQLSASEQIR